MKCAWDTDARPITHIPQICGKDAVVILHGPRECQYTALCEEHKTLAFKMDSPYRSWKRFTPAEFKVYRVMTE
jgi:hypothetical protein